MPGAKTRLRRRQSGAFLLEALVSVVIFTIGLIALIGVSTQAVNMVGQSKTRNDASYLAGELIGEMWVSGSAPMAFNTDAWKARVADQIRPGGVATVNVNGTTVDILITWNDKKDADVVHKYETRAEIARN